MKIGKPKYGGGSDSFVATKYWKLKDGESVYRILPPIGDLADEGIWSIFYKVHYGYRNSEGRMRVFQSSLVQNRKTKMVEVPDAALERIEKLKSELERAKASGNGVAVSKLKELTQMYNLDNNHYVNAMDLQGNIGVLKLRHRAKQALDAEIKRMEKEGIDPLSPEDGRFLVFRRAGNGLDTTFSVTVAQESVDVPNVGRVKRDLSHKLTPDIVSRLSREARQLDKLFRKLSADEIGRIVKESDIATGKSRAIDEIFDTKSDSSGGSEGGDFGDDSGDYSSGSHGSESYGATASAQTAAPVATAAIEAQVSSDFTSMVGDLNPSSGGTITGTTIVSSPAVTTEQKVEKMDEQEFQKYLSTLGL